MKQIIETLIGIIAIINLCWLITRHPVLMGTLFGVFSFLFLILLALCNAAGRADEVKLEFEDLQEWIK